MSDENEDENEAALTLLRRQRSLDREATAPEREIEEEDSACAEILNNLRSRSKSGEAAGFASFRRRGSAEAVKRKTSWGGPCRLEVLTEGGLVAPGGEEQEDKQGRGPTFV